MNQGGKIIGREASFSGGKFNGCWSWRGGLFFWIVWLGLFVSSLGHAAEPTYEGKSASFWLEHFYDTNSQPRAAVTAFKAMGSNAVPFLIKTLEQKPSALGKAVDDQVYGGDPSHRVPQGVLNALPSAMRTEEKRDRAVYLIQEIGPDAAEAIPSLMTILNDPNEGWRMIAGARGALLAMGERLAGEVPRLIDYLKSNDREDQQLGAVLLASIGPKGRAAVPALLKLAETGNGWVTVSVAQALWNIDRQTNAAVTIYTNVLQTTNSTEKQVALIYLRKMGAAARGAGPQLQAMLDDPDDLVRREVEAALREIDPSLLLSSQQSMNRQIPERVAKLVETIQSGQTGHRLRALETIAIFGPDAKPAVPVLIEVLSGSAPRQPGPLSSIGLMDSRPEAALALGEIGPEARAAVPALINLVTGSRDGFVAAYCRALGGIGPDAQEAVMVLEKTMQHENRGIRLAAATALTRIVPGQSSNAVVVLRALQNDSELAAVWTMDRDGIPHRQAATNFDNPAYRFFHAAASVPLWRLGIEKKTPVPALIAELERPSSSDETSLINLLGDIGPEAAPALEKLKKIVESERFIGHRRAAAIAIRKIDPAEAARLGLPGVLGVP